VLRVTSTIFGVTYRPVTGVPVWHPSVRVYEMREGDRIVGRVYLDLHPRANKTASGATTFTVRAGREGRSLPEVVLAASLPGNQAGDPGLMTHDEVRTLFHEFGHVVHRLSGGHQPWGGLSSIPMERDFTEAPSQMLEEWIWDPKTLATFARHYQTGEPIPAALVQQMRRASEFGQGIEVAQQMVLARVSLAVEPPAFSLLAVTIKTGRTHQIRVHLASDGHAIAGDDKYGDFDRNRALQKLGLKRMFLHAWRLDFIHPASGERMALQAELPAELRALVPQPALDALASPASVATHD